MTDPGTILIIIGFVLMFVPPLHLTIRRTERPKLDTEAAGAVLHSLYDTQRPSPEIDALSARVVAALDRVATNGRRIHH